MNYAICVIHLIVCFIVLAAGMLFVGLYFGIDVPVTKKGFHLMIFGVISIPVAIAFSIIEWNATFHESIVCLRVLAILFLILGILGLGGFLVMVEINIRCYFTEKHLNLEPLAIGFFAFALPSAYFFPIGLYRFMLGRKWARAKKELEAEIATAEVISW